MNARVQTRVGVLQHPSLLLEHVQQHEHVVLGVSAWNRKSNMHVPTRPFVCDLIFPARAGQQSVKKELVRPKPPAPPAGWTPELGMPVDVSSSVDAVQGNAWFPGVVNELNGNFVFIM